MIEGQDRLRIRSRYYPLVGGSVVIGAAIYGVWQGLDDPELGAGFAVGWAAVAAVLLYRLVRVALIEKHDRLVVRNVFSTRHLAWSDIETVRVVSIPGNLYTAAVAFRVKQRRFRRTASATTCYSRARAKWICEMVAARAAVHGVACDLDADTLRSGLF